MASKATEAIVVEADDGGVEQFTEMLRQGLIEGAAEAVHAVQQHLDLRTEESVRLSRPVLNGEGEVMEAVGTGPLVGTIRARKLWNDPGETAA